MQKVLFPWALQGCPVRATVSNRQPPSLPPSVTMTPFELLGTKAEINLALTRCQQHSAELHLGNEEPSGELGRASESHVTELPGTQGGGEAMSRLCLEVLVGGRCICTRSEVVSSACITGGNEELPDEESASQCRRHGFNPWSRKIPWRRKWQPTPIFLPGAFQGQRSLAVYSPWGHEESDTT